ncbi:uncharacterized protein EAE97_012201 [Botrytis byssoidea]|uniref:Uncharacterized protein n=1 Tax=Botrytis byssoidea TaxID=139641 RepID=A0A9P5LHZ0_9HELO|nr:uncharacterized protein EAE97_012201 [Botrytis byssoidea]KAF7915562.1 hypothetical protein EAE97_012201 [Botrytis byssoidea]
MPKCEKCGHSTSTCTCCKTCKHRQSKCTCKTKGSSSKTKGSSSKNDPGSGSGSDDSKKSDGSRRSNNSNNSKKSDGSHQSGKSAASGDSQKTHNSGKSELTELTKVYSGQIRSIIEECEREITETTNEQPLPNTKVWTDEMKDEYAKYKAIGIKKDDSRRVFQGSYNQSLKKNASAKDLEILRKDALTWAGLAIDEMNARLGFLTKYEGAYYNTKGHIEAVKNLSTNGKRAVNHARLARSRIEKVKMTS